MKIAKLKESIKETIKNVAVNIKNNFHPFSIVKGVAHGK